MMCFAVLAPLFTNNFIADAFAPSSTRILPRIPNNKNAIYFPPKRSSLCDHSKKRTNNALCMTLNPIASVPRSVIARGFAIGTSLALLIGYHVRLRLWEKKENNMSWRSHQAGVREQWSHYVRSNEAWLYAIQTLRNAITANTFLATTVLSLLTVIAGRGFSTIQNSGSSPLFTVQFVAVTLSMLSSAYQFLQSARLMTHAGFMFPVSPESNKVDNIMRRSQNCQWAGLRLLYISISFISWTIGGEIAFLLTSMGMVQFFSSIDQAPEGTVGGDTYKVILK